jgi:hypothetical protein
MPIKAQQVLLIPALTTRTSLPETISSIHPYLRFFDRVFISMNGFVGEFLYMDIFIDLEHQISGRLTILKTRTLLSATEHCFFIVNHLQEILSKDDFVMLLADDDLICPNVNLKTYFDKLLLSPGAAVGVSRFAFLPGDQPCLDLNQSLYSGETVDPLTFLIRDSTGHRFTSMSGMIVPFKVLKEVAVFIKLFHGSGGRFEYMLMTHKDIKNLYSPDIPIARIRFHSHQESRRLSSIDHLFNECLYVIWIWIHHPKTLPWAKGSKAYGFTIARLAHYLRRIVLLRFYGMFAASSKCILK